MFHSRENDITGIIDNTFTVEHESFGVLQMRELKPGGSNIVVTEDNKKEYVKLYVNYRFMQVSHTCFVNEKILWLLLYCGAFFFIFMVTHFIKDSFLYFVFNFYICPLIMKLVKTPWDLREAALQFSRFNDMTEANTLILHFTIFRVLNNSLLLFKRASQR